MKIKYINNIYAQITEGLEDVQKILEYEKEYWQQGKFRKERMTYQAKMYSKTGKILAGLVPYIKNHCEGKGIDCEVNGINLSLPTLDKDAELLGATLRPEQLRLVQSAITKLRGILKGFTSVGKSYILADILNHYPSAKFLVLVHRVGLVDQLHEAFLEFGLDSGRFTGEIKEEGHRITVGSIKTCVKYDWCVDGVFIDEVHHVSGMKTQYAKLLSKLDVPIRIGFSATPKTKADGEGFFASTGFLGPIIDEVDFQEGEDLGLLIPVKLKFIKVPINHEIKKITNYNNFIDIGIVQNNRRNKLIIETAHELVKENKSGLILIVKTEHGERLQKMARDIFDWEIPFVYGGTPTEQRNIIKQKLEKKEHMCTIASIVWTEGISISSLDSLYLGFIGKKESMVLQCFGRGLRRSPGKEEVQIYDFLDLSSKYSIKQLGERLLTYSEFGWL